MAQQAECRQRRSEQQSCFGCECSRSLVQWYPAASDSAKDETKLPERKTEHKLNQS